MRSVRRLRLPGVLTPVRDSEGLDPAHRRHAEAASIVRLGPPTQPDVDVSRPCCEYDGPGEEGSEPHGVITSRPATDPVDEFLEQDSDADKDELLTMEAQDDRQRRDNPGTRTAQPASAQATDTRRDLRLPLDLLELRLGSADIRGALERLGDRLQNTS